MTAAAIPRPTTTPKLRTIAEKFALSRNSRRPQGSKPAAAKDNCSGN